MCSATGRLVAEPLVYPLTSTGGPAGGNRMQFNQLKRREFIGLLAGAVATRPVTARAEQPLNPVVGFLSGRSPAKAAGVVGAFETVARVCADFFGRGGKVRVGS